MAYWIKPRSSLGGVAVGGLSDVLRDQGDSPKEATRKIDNHVKEGDGDHSLRTWLIEECKSLQAREDISEVYR